MPSKSAICSILIGLVGVALLGCGGGALDPANVGKVRLYDPKEQEQMKTALSNARIQFELHDDADGNEEIWYDSRFQAQVLSVQDQVFGVAPPTGRNLVLGSERLALFAEEMRKHGAEFRTGIYHGSQYVAWDPPSDEAADVALERASVSLETRAEMRRQRKLVDAERSARTKQ